MDHVEACGNKTTPCDKCGAYVRNKDREDHMLNNGCEKERAKQRAKDEIEKDKKMKELKKF